MNKLSALDADRLAHLILEQLTVQGSPFDHGYYVEAVDGNIHRVILEGTFDIEQCVQRAVERL